MKSIFLITLLGLIVTDFTKPGTEPQFSVNQISSMKLNTGFVTNKLKETKDFYQHVLQFGISFENDFYLLMHTPDQQAQIAFLLPDHPTQQKLFQPAFEGKGAFITIEVPDVDAEYKRIQDLNIPIEIPIRNEPWGDRHFAVVDPNGIGIDFVTYTAPSPK
jgi:catechol 2,3-dioxygenase-like lactoylglutathione lyase family enzyme